MKYEFNDASGALNKFRRVKFNFRTLQKDGLLLYGPSEDLQGVFASFELKDGHLVYRYNSGEGDGNKMLSSKGILPPLNDGVVHFVNKGRKTLKIDNVLIAEYTKSSQDLSAQFAYIGGVPFGQKMTAR